MAGWDGAGGFTRVHDWTDDDAAGENIEASRMDAEDDNFAAGIAACRAKNGENAATGDLPMGGNVHTGVGDGTARNHYAAVGQVQDGDLTSGTSGGAANVQTLTLSPAITAYTSGMVLTFRAGFTNTGQATMNVNGVGAKYVKLNGVNTPAHVSGGEIIADCVYTIVFDLTENAFILINPTMNAADNLVCSVLRGNTQAIGSGDQGGGGAGSGTAISWDTEIVDYGGFWAPGNPTRLTVPYTGIYELNVYIEFAPNAVGYRQGWFYEGGDGGVGVYGGLTTAPADANPNGALSFVSTATLLTAADYIEVFVKQTAGGSLNCVAAASIKAL